MFKRRLPEPPTHDHEEDQRILRHLICVAILEVVTERAALDRELRQLSERGSKNT